MSLTLGFDIYGTLINPHGLLQQLTEKLGDRAVQFSTVWRDKQLEYTFRRGLMKRYENFEICTRDALNYTDQFLNTKLDDAFKLQLLQAYRKLPAFDDVRESLERVSEKGFRLFAFSNGLNEAIEELLEHAGIRQYFEGIVSVDDVKSFKPDPAIYQYFLEKTGSKAENSWLVSSNPFDIIGAVDYGLNAAWLKRAATALFDPWEIEPTREIADLSELVNLAVD
ncbi:MAG: 2-haloacid dehalogenase [Gammaproteobacteria bacterium]|jgi:2-haloacid dehalogenase